MCRESAYGCSLVTKVSRKKFFLKKKICFLQNMYYLQKKNIFVRNKHFMQKKKLLLRKKIFRKKLFI